MKTKKRGQVWIETVIYTLIGLTLIGVVLSFVTPRINEAKDRAVVEQTINSLNILDGKIDEVSSSPGSRRIVDFGLKRGSLYVNGSGESIMFELNDLGKPYSEVGIAINSSNLEIVSLASQKTYSVYLTLKYKNKFDITYSGNDDLKKLTSTQIPYRLLITNKPIQGNVRQIDIEDISGR